MYRLRKLAVLLTVAVAALSVTIPATHAKPPKHRADAKAAAQISPAPNPIGLKYRGVVIGAEEFYTATGAATTMKRVTDVGFNSVREVVRWFGESSPSDITLAEVCNAARQAETQGLTALLISLQPKYDLWPARDDQFASYRSTLETLIHRLFDDKCVSSVSSLQIMWMIGNEPNLPSFCNVNMPVEADRQLECAKRAARLLHESYKLIKDYSQAMLVIGCGVSSHGNPFGYMDQYKKALSDLEYTTPDMDYCAVHPYALPGGDINSGLKLAAKMTQKIKEVFGVSIPMIFTEMGAETLVPADKGYQDKTPDSVHPIHEDQYTSIFREWGRLIKAQPDVAGFFNFELIDETSLKTGWQSGMYYRDGSPKSFLPDIRKILDDMASLCPTPRGLAGSRATQPKNTCS